jgi:hypothetical protein
MMQYSPRGSAWPTIALEVGYTETHADLIEDARQLLVVTEGQIGLVIIIKIEPLKQGQTTI